MTEQTDLQLIESFRNGNDQAFNHLVIRYQQRVYWAARRILGSHEDADDAVQEVFVRVYRKLHTFRGSSEFFTWLYRIAINVSLNASRKRKIGEFFNLDALHDRQPAEREDPESILIRGEERSLLDRAVARLPEKQKAVFMMRYHEGMKFEEIASMLDRSVGGVKSNFFHALRKIDRFVREENR